MKDATRQEVLGIGSGNNVILHKYCDGEVFLNVGSFECSNCKSRWSYSWIDRSATDDDIALRFKVKPPPDPNVYKLIEKQDGKVLYTKLEKQDKVTEIIIKDDWEFNFPW